MPPVKCAPRGKPVKWTGVAYQYGFCGGKGLADLGPSGEIRVTR